MIHPEKGLHSNHPGHSQVGCPLQMQINAHSQGSSHNGYACSWTGGHCMKSDECVSRVAQHKEEEKL